MQDMRIADFYVLPLMLYRPGRAFLLIVGCYIRVNVGDLQFLSRHLNTRIFHMLKTYQGKNGKTLSNASVLLQAACHEQYQQKYVESQKFER